MEKFWILGYQFEAQCNLFGSGISDHFESKDNQTLIEVNEYIDRMLDINDEANKDEFPDYWNELNSDPEYSEIFNNSEALKYFTTGRRIWWSNHLLQEWISWIQN